jgi:hypothetical protein
MLLHRVGFFCMNWLFCIIPTTFMLQTVAEYSIWDSISKWINFCKECKTSQVLVKINSNLWRLQNLSLWLTSILCLKPWFSKTPQSYLRDAWWFLRNGVFVDMCVRSSFSLQCMSNQRTLYTPSCISGLWNEQKTRKAKPWKRQTSFGFSLHQ